MKNSSWRSRVGASPYALGFVIVAIVAACGGNTTGVAGDAGKTPGFGLAGSGANGSNGANGGSSVGAGGATSPCIVGTQGCFCDSSGGCAPGLSCSPQGGGASVCCSGGNCGSSGGGVGATCGSVGGASCTPGITILSGSGNSDGCGYPTSTFVESTTLCAINAVGGGAQPAVIQVFYNDEHALTLGCATSADPVSALPSDPGSVSYPQTGDPACVDAVARPLRPVLYVTDTTADPSCTAGDQQKGGQPYDPIAVFGTWKSASEGAGNVGTPAMTDPTANNWNLGSGADTPPATATGSSSGGAAMPGMGAGMKPGMGPGAMGGMPPPPAMGGCNEGYGAELRFEVALVSGHSYRFQVIVHDGDQNKGGDSGEACAVFCAGTGSSCAPGVVVCPAADSNCPEGTVCTDGCCAPPGGVPTVTPDASTQTTR